MKLAACTIILAGLVHAGATLAATGGRADTSSRGAIARVFGARAAKALHVAECETHGTLDPRAANPADHHSDGSRGSWGLFQIGSVHRRPGETVAHFRARMFDPIANARMAWKLSHGGTSWAPWVVCGA